MCAHVKKHADALKRDMQIDLLSSFFPLLLSS